MKPEELSEHEERISETINRLETNMKRKSTMKII
jgi:hypothetical protein